VQLWHSTTIAIYSTRMNPPVISVSVPTTCAVPHSIVASFMPLRVSTLASVAYVKLQRMRASQHVAKCANVLHLTVKVQHERQRRNKGLIGRRVSRAKDDFPTFLRYSSFLHTAPFILPKHSLAYLFFALQWQTSLSSASSLQLWPPHRRPT
jgi:hypothetical protein